MKLSLSSLCGQPNRLPALRRFAATITIVTILGHVYLGFETSYSITVVSVLTACVVQLLLEWIRTKSAGIAPGYSNGQLFNFLLAPYIVGMTCAMFLFPNGRLWPIIFASTLAICSKNILRVKTGDRTTHFLNPSNLSILVTLLAFPAVTVVMPYSFSAGPGDVGDVVLPVVLFIAGCLLNGIYTKRLVLIFSWFGAFVLQAFARYLLFDSQLLAMLAVATGPIAIIFSFYMISDPATTPDKPLPQIAFGLSIGVLYGILTVAHVIFGLFWALFLTCVLRGLCMFIAERRSQWMTARAEKDLQVTT